MLNRSVNAKMTGSVLLEKKHRKSELLLFNPRSSFIKGKHSQAMHGSIVNSNKAYLNLANASVGPFDKHRRLSNFKQDRTFKLGSVWNNRNNSIADKS